MFNRRKIEKPLVKITFCKYVLDAIFDECGNFNVDETGGRIIGFYQRSGALLNIEVCGLIGSGPNARRSPTSFFQDGVHQEVVFRKIEADYPDIEHLGNWHTHHVNGLNTLSSGDIDTYKRIVNHEKHNTDFFYALLVIAKKYSLHNQERYGVRHFLFRRGESLVYEIPPGQIKIIRKSSIFIDRVKKPDLESDVAPGTILCNQPTVNSIRLKDKEIMADLCPDLKPFFSKQTSSLYWKGEITLIDAAPVEFLILESLDETKPSYSITLIGPKADSFQCKQVYSKRNFDSAWRAALSFERDLNREIYNNIKDK